MRPPHPDGWTRRRFLGGLTVAGTAGLLGWQPRLVAAEPPPETTRLRLGRNPAICGAPGYVAAQFLPGEGFTEVHYVETPGLLGRVDELKSSLTKTMGYGRCHVTYNIRKINELA
jgi:NitT/TauT family transport system substrate-binding protein